jgi:hypothetical protein
VNTTHVIARIRLVVQGTGGNQSFPIDGELKFDVRDPLAVTLVMRSPHRDQDVTWALARELLADGLHRPCGEGDVRVLPAPADEHGDRVHVTLAPPDARPATLEVGAEHLRQFLDETYRLVPAGREFDAFDLDAEIERLINF